MYAALPLLSQKGCFHDLNLCLQVTTME
uniref:Uncharacterized protein n=1 Tax=Rhizophora mucronata TaxID=61149 RepID=A0A2P2IYF5_RHIMU